MTVNYSEQLHNILLYSLQEAERLGNNYIGPEHLLLGIIRNGKGKAIDILNHTQVDLSKIKQSIESQIRTDNEPTGEEILSLKSTERIKKIMELETRS
ncbi:MAG TPA: Clp protease N-terminal domain-containing protein, partial [Paludibacteraceae bacterium]|nr:Clp protease N-terminal domain-containing protein [Paludibacteraceae bacterium]